MIPQVALDNSVVSWVAERIPHVGKSGFEKPFGVSITRNGRLLAGIVYHDYQPDHRTIQMSAAATSPMWAHRLTIGVFLSIPFEQLGCFKVWTATPHDNTPAIKVNLKAGFTVDGVLDHQFGPDRHAVICRLLEPDYQRLYKREYDGQEI